MKEIKPGYVRVSTILSIVPSPVDGKFCFPLQLLDQEMLSNKANIGSNVHAAIDAHVKGDFYPISDVEMGYYESYLAWAEKVNLKPIETELRLYCDAMKITGCVDMIAQIQGRNDWLLIDFKTTVNEDAKKWPLQAALYSLLLSQNRFGWAKNALFVQLDKRGEIPNVYEYEITNELQTAALSAYNLHKYVMAK